LALGVAGVVLAVYLRTLSPTTDIADSLEFQVVARDLGFAHPPGYPLYIVLGKLFTLLPAGDIAYRMNLFSAVAAAAAAGMVYVVAARLTRCPPAAVAAALTFAFAPAVWSLAVITEVYALNVLIVATVIYGLVRWTEAVAAARRAPGWLWLATLAFTLGTMHHLTIIFVAPVMVGAVLLNDPRLLTRPRAVAGLAGAVALGWTPALYFFIRSPEVAGRRMAVIEVVRYVTAHSYSGLFRPDWPIRDPSRWLMLRYELMTQFDGLMVALILSGLVWMIRRRAQWALWLGVTFGLYTAFRLGYNAWDGWVVLLPAHVIAAIGLAAGCAGVGGWLAGRADGPRSRLRATAVWTLVLLLPVVQVWRNGRTSDMSGGWAEYPIGPQVLALDLPPGASIITDPQLGSALLYPRLFQGARPDVRVLYGDAPSGRRLLEDPTAADGPVYLLGLTPDADRSYHPGSLGPLVELGERPRLDPGPIPRQVALPGLGTEGPLELLGFTLDPGGAGTVLAGDAVRPGGTLGVTLFWRAPPTVSGDYVVRLRLVRDGVPLPGDIGGRPVAGFYPTARWTPHEVVPDYHVLSIDPTALPGGYDLEVALDRVVNAASGSVTDAVGGAGASGATDGARPILPPPSDRVAWRRLGRIDVEAAGPELATRVNQSVRADWVGGIRLLGYDAPAAVRPGDPVDLVLFWRRTGPAPAERVILRVDGGAAGSDEVTLPGADGWQEGRVIATRHRLTTPASAEDGPLPVRLRLSAAGHVLSHRPAKGLWWRESDFQLTSVQVRAKLVGLDAPAVFSDGIRLVGIERPSVLHPGQRLLVGLTWEAYAPPARRYKVSLQLVDARQGRRANEDREILHGTRPTSTWRQGDLFRDVMPLDVPDDLPPGGYQLEVVLYDQETRGRLPLLDARGRPAADRVAFGVVVAPDSLPAVLRPSRAVFGGEIALRGYSMSPGPTIAPGDTLTVTLRWEALHRPSHDYTLFAHLLHWDVLVTQWDGQPFGGVFPTGAWPVGQPLDVPVTLVVPPDLAPGEYHLAVGWYDLRTGRRLAVAGGGADGVADEVGIGVWVR